MARVSAVVVVYNRAALIGRAIDSILAQSVPVQEVIVVDDGSTDGTGDVVQQRYGDRVRLIRQQNAGVSGARRRGLMEATGEWVAFLDSDDEWTPNRNAALLDAAARVPHAVAWIFGDAVIVGDGGETRRLFRDGRLEVQRLTVFDDPMPTQYPYQFSLMMNSLIKTAVLREVEAFSENLRSSEDLLAGWKVAARYPMAAIPEVVARIHREAELAGTSTDIVGKASPDYFHARVIGFDSLSRSSRPGAWGRMHAESMRRWCIRLVQKGQGRPFRMALAQFKHGFTPKAAAFTVAAAFGRPGVRAWVWATTRRDRALADAGPRIADPVSYSKSAVEHAQAVTGSAR